MTGYDMSPNAHNNVKSMGKKRKKRKIKIDAANTGTNQFCISTCLKESRQDSALVKSPTAVCALASLYLCANNFNVYDRLYV